MAIKYKGATLICDGNMRDTLTVTVNGPSTSQVVFRIDTRDREVTVCVTADEAEAFANVLLSQIADLRRSQDGDED